MMILPFNDYIYQPWPSVVRRALSVSYTTEEEEEREVGEELQVHVAASACRSQCMSQPVHVAASVCRSQCMSKSFLAVVAVAD